MADRAQSAGSGGQDAPEVAGAAAGANDGEPERVLHALNHCSKSSAVSCCDVPLTESMLLKHSSTGLTFCWLCCPLIT